MAKHALYFSPSVVDELVELCESDFTQIIEVLFEYAHTGEEILLDFCIDPKMKVLYSILKEQVIREGGDDE